MRSGGSRRRGAGRGGAERPRRGAQRRGGTVTGRGRRLGVDVGSVRVGVALSDPDGVLATPLATVARDAPRGSDLDTIAGLVAEHDVVGVVVGLPRTLAGREGPAAEAAREFATALAARLSGGVPVVFS